MFYDTIILFYCTPLVYENKTYIKKNKATGPVDIKGELYRSLGRSEMCVAKLHTALQNIIDKDLK